METRSYRMHETIFLQTRKMRRKLYDIGKNGGDVECDRSEEAGGEKTLQEQETREIRYGELQAYSVEWLQEYAVGNGYNEKPKGEGIEDNLRFVDELQCYLR